MQRGSAADSYSAPEILSPWKLREPSSPHPSPLLQGEDALPSVAGLAASTCLSAAYGSPSPQGRGLGGGGSSRPTWKGAQANHTLTQLQTERKSTRLKSSHLGNP